MSELQIPKLSALPTMRQAPAALDRSQWADELMSWAAAAQKAHDIACVLCQTSFVPKSMRDNPGEVTGAILTGMELNVPIMWALANIDIVEGVPGLRAKALRALAFRGNHEMWTEESTATRAVVCGRRRNGSKVEKSVWTLDRARKAELLHKKNWQRYPQDMLLNRATAEVFRLIAPDELIGVSYTVDELGGDEGPADGMPIVEDDAPKTAPKKRTAQRKTTPAAPPPDLPDDAPAPPVSEQNLVDGPGEDPATWTLASTCDVGMPHDGRYSAPEGCPPRCPTRLAANEPPQREIEPAPAEDENEAARMMADAGLAPEVIDVQLPEGDGDWPEPAKPPDAPEMIRDNQRRRMAVEMRKAGLIERAERLAFVSDIVKREIETSNDLTVQEASRVIQAVIDLITEQGLDDAARGGDE